MDKQIRLTAASVIVSSKLSKPTKLQLLNFVKEEATLAQVKALLLDGEIVTLDEEAEKIVNERFKTHPFNSEGGCLAEAGTVLGVLGVLTGVLPFWRALASTFSDAQRQCGVIKISKDRDACLAKARLNYAKKRIQILQKASSKCGETKSPDNCKKLLASHIAKEQNKASKQAKKLQALTMKGRVSGEEPAKFVTTRA